MTENEREIQRVIKYIRSCREAGIDTTITLDISKSHFILNALEEIQQYRAIGTVEECELAINESIDKHNLMIVYKDILKEFEEIGTVDEFKALKEKSEPKKPHQNEYFEHDYYCPCCGGILAESVDDDCDLEELAGWCSHCGQAIDWS